MARTIENASRDLVHPHALGLGKRAQIVARLGVEIDEVLGIAATDGDLIHVDVRRMEQAAALGERDHAQRIGHGLGGERRSLQGIERDVDGWSIARAHGFADVQHGRLVALALADHDGAAYVDAVERFAHGIDRGLIGGPLVAAANESRRGKGGRFRHARELERQCPVDTRPRPFHARLAAHLFSLCSVISSRRQNASMRIMQGGSNTVFA